MTSGEVTTSPALADLDGDGVLDVVVTDMDCSTGAAQNFNVYAFKGTGALMWKTKPMAYAGVNLSAGQPVVADVSATRSSRSSSRRTPRSASSRTPASS